MRAILIAIAVLSATACFSKMASCQTQMYSATVVGNQVNGTNLWNYTLRNTSLSSSYTVILVQLEVDELTQIIQAPPVLGWYIDATTPGFVTWASKDDGLGAGRSVSSFAAQFTNKPEYQYWSAVFNNIDDPGECPVDGGAVLNAAVPEPSGIASFAIGMMSLFGMVRRKRA